jgi:hypothetical protein
MKRLNQNEITLRVMPQRLAWWPAANTNTAWTALHDCVDALHALIGTLEEACRATEDDRDLQPGAIKRRVASLGKTALPDLTNFAPFAKAQRAVANNLEGLQKRLADVPPAPSNYQAVANAVEVREHMRALKVGHDKAVTRGMEQRPQRAAAFAEQNLGDPDVVSAWLWSKPFQSGLSDAEFNALREKLRATVNPVSSDMIKKLTKAMDELTSGMALAKKIVMERAGLVQHIDGSIRMQGEPAPKMQAAE